MVLELKSFRIKYFSQTSVVGFWEKGQLREKICQKNIALIDFPWSSKVLNVKKSETLRWSSTLDEFR